VRWIHAIGELKPLENILFGTVQDITDRKVSAEALRNSQEELKKFAAHLQNVREEERNLLAREIHDDLGQILIAMKIDMGMLKNSVFKIAENEKSDLRTKFDNLQIMIDNTLKSARRIMTDLRPEVLDMLGFTDTLKQHLENFQQRYNINCKFKNSTLNLQLNSQQSVALFRIVQEALNNVVKHSSATKVEVTLNIKENKLTLEVIDNGIGFDKNNKKNNDSYGLMGMKERIYLLEGELIIDSKKDSGTAVKVIMPYLDN
jgi:signal transduction histidine kinase